MKREIVFRINLETAETTMEAVGWNGQGCRAATKSFEGQDVVLHGWSA